MPKELDVVVNTEMHGQGSDAYCICPDGLGKDSIVYGCGVGNNVSFDLSLIERYGLKVFAFDPTEQAKRFIEQANMPQNFIFENVGIANHDGELTLFHLRRPSSSYLAGTTLAIGNFQKGAHTISVKRLPTVMQQYGHDHIDILKLDIEGGEYDVLEDMLESGIRPGQVTLEFHPQLANMADHGNYLGHVGWKKTELLINALREAGYRLFYISDRGTEFSFILQKRCPSI